MIKKLLTLAFMAAATVSASADTVTLWEGETTFESWDQNVLINASDLTALAAGDKITAELKDCGSVIAKDYSTIVLKTNTDGWPELDGCGYDNPQAGATQWSWELGADAVSTAKSTGIIIQGENFILTKVTLTTAADIDVNLLWEGEVALTNWAAGGDVTSSKVKVGDVITYKFTGTAESDAQALIKDASWSEVSGTSKINADDMNTGKVVFGITSEAEATLSTKFFLQGEKGATLVKVERTAENGFDTKTTLSYGERVLPSEQFITIPESAKTLSVTFDKRPSWIQLCDGSWNSLVSNESDNASFEVNDDNTVTMTATIDSDFIAAINSSKKLVLNGGGASALYITYGDGTVGIADIEADADAPVEYFNLQGVRVENPSNGLYIRRQGNKVEKVIL